MAEEDDLAGADQLRLRRLRGARRCARVDRHQQNMLRHMRSAVCECARACRRVVFLACSAYAPASVPPCLLVYLSLCPPSSNRTRPPSDPMPARARTKKHPPSAPPPLLTLPPPPPPPPPPETSSPSSPSPSSSSPPPAAAADASADKEATTAAAAAFSSSSFFGSGTPCTMIVNL